MTQQSTLGNLCVCVCLNLFSDAPKLSYVRGVSTFQDVCLSVHIVSLDKIRKTKIIAWNGGDVHLKWQDFHQ